MAKPEQEGAGTGSLLPALELAHARLRVTEDQPVGRQVVQGELHVCRHVLELRQPRLPVVSIRCHDVRAVDRVGLRARAGHPRVAHLHDLGRASGLARRVLVDVGQLRRGRLGQPVTKQKMPAKAVVAPRAAALAEVLVWESPSVQGWVLALG